MGYRAAGFTVELRDMGHYGFRLPPDQVSVKFFFPQKAQFRGIASALNRAFHRAAAHTSMQ